MVVKKNGKKRVAKQIVSKSFYKKIGKIGGSLTRRFWAFLGEGSSKTP
jgi:hypothetical protein